MTETSIPEPRRKTGPSIKAKLESIIEGAAKLKALIGDGDDDDAMFDFIAPLDDELWDVITTIEDAASEVM